jgi:hypothetical protein
MLFLIYVSTSAQVVRRAGKSYMFRASNRLTPPGPIVGQSLVSGVSPHPFSKINQARYNPQTSPSNDRQSYKGKSPGRPVNEITAERIQRDHWGLEAAMRADESGRDPQAFLA